MFASRAAGMGVDESDKNGTLKDSAGGGRGSWGPGGEALLSLSSTQQVCRPNSQQFWLLLLVGRLSST